MLRHGTTRPLVALAALTLLCLASLGAKKEEAKAEPPKAIRVAILPIVNGSPELGATKIMEDILRDQLKAMPAERARFLYPNDTERILTARDAADRLEIINDRWSKYGTLDSTAVDGLDSLIQVDAILCVKVSEWENLRVNVVGRGESHTTVGLQFTLFDIVTRKKTWSKDPREQRFAQEVDISSGTVNYDETGYIQSRNVTDPPRYEDVANDLVRSAFKKFPQK